MADLSIGVVVDALPPPKGIAVETIGELSFVFAVAPHHPLATATDPISDEQLVNHRAVAVSDSTRHLAPLTYNVLPGQDVFRVPNMPMKIEAQIRGMGCGFLPEPLARPHIESGLLVAKAMQRERPAGRMGYAWRSAAAPQPKKAPQGLGLAWWLEQLARPTTRKALIDRHAGLRPVNE